MSGPAPKGASSPSDIVVAIDVTPAGDAPHKENDRAWFEENNRRGFRLRRRLPGEPCPDPRASHAIVRQLMPGVRDKLFFASTKGSEVLDRLPNTDLFGMALWIELERGQDGFPIQRALQAAQLMAAQSARCER